MPRAALMPARIDHVTRFIYERLDVCAFTDLLYFLIANEQRAVFDDRELAQFGANPRACGARESDHL